MLRFDGGARDVTIHRPVGTAAKVSVAGGANGFTFDDQFYKAVAGDAVWKTADFEQAGDRYEIAFTRGVRGIVVDTVEPKDTGRGRRLLATVLFTDIVGSTEQAQVAGDERWRELRQAGIEIRAGVHTGELELRDDDVGGIAVHLGARIMAAAGPGEVLVSRTVRDLVAGSGIHLEDRGTHTLKGLSDPWQLFAADE